MCVFSLFSSNVSSYYQVSRLGRNIVGIETLSQVVGSYRKVMGVWGRPGMVSDGDQSSLVARLRIVVYSHRPKNFLSCPYKPIILVSTVLVRKGTHNYLPFS